MYGTTVGVIKGDPRSSDHGSLRVWDLRIEVWVLWSFVNFEVRTI